MKKTAFITAAVVLLSQCSCSFENFGYDPLPSESEGKTDFEESSVFQDVSYETVDIDELNEEIEKLLDDVKIPDNERSVREDIDFLINKANIASDAMAYSCIDSYSVWDDSHLQSVYEKYSEDYYVVCSALEYAFSKGNTYDEYAEIFEEFITDEYIEYYTQKGMSLARAEGYASVDYRVSDKNIDDYYEVYYDSDLNDDDKNIQCADIYLDILSNIDPDFYYESFNRDYTPDEIVELSGVVKEKLLPIDEEFYDKFSQSKNADKIWETDEKNGDPFETIREYSSKLSSDIKESADRIIDEKLYTLASGDNCYTGSFTTDLPTNNSALVYIYTDNSCNDLLTAIHEFGHFHSSFYDETDAYSSQLNVDLAEVQSQGMEVLFIPLFDEIYGKSSDAVTNFEIYNLVDSVVVGFLIGEFEYKALMQADELTSEEIIELYNDIMGNYADDFPFYYVSHIFEVPGYYIGYAVSALAALEIYNVSCDDPSAALEMYENIAKIPVNSKDVRFKESLEKCGFDNLLTEEHITKLADRLSSILADDII